MATPERRARYLLVFVEAAMSEAIWEEIVQTYLTTNRSVLVSRQWEVKGADNWEICPDLLAVDFGAREVWFVEVTSAWDVNAIADKAKVFEVDVVPRMKSQLAELGILPDASHWKLGMWAFVRKERSEALMNTLGQHVKLYKVETLDRVAFPWEYWAPRRADEHRANAAAT